MGCTLAYARRQWLALSLLPQAIALAALYTVIFAEPRYRLPIFMLLLPLSAMALGWLWQTGRALIRRTPTVAWKREAALAIGFAAMVFIAAPALAWAGGKLRERHGWAVDECEVDGKTQFCRWRVAGVDGDLHGRTAVKGVWDGVGLTLPIPAHGLNGSVAVETEFELAQGDYILSAALDFAPFSPAEEIPSGSIWFSSNGQTLSPAVVLADVVDASREGKSWAWRSPLHHAGGALRLRVEVSSARDPSLPTRLWISQLRAEHGS